MGIPNEAPVQTAPVESTPVVQAAPQASVAELVDQMAHAAISSDYREVARLNALMDEMGKAPAPKEEAPPAPVSEPVVEQPVAEVPAVETPAVETPEAKPEIEEPHKEPERFRFKDDQDKAVAMMAKSENISLVEAAKRYEAMRATAAPKEEPVAAVDATLASLEAEVATLEAQMDEVGANEGLFNSDVAKLNKALIKANARLESYRGSSIALAAAKDTIAQTDRAKTEAQIQAQWKANEAEAAKAFPDVANPDSLLNDVMRSLNEKMKDPAHPDHAQLFKSTAPLFLARKAAEKIGVKAAGTQAAPAPAAPVAKETVVRPAPGSLGSAPAAPAVSDADRIKAAEERANNAMTGGGRNRRSANSTIFI
jgi:ribonuclease E